MRKIRKTLYVDLAIIAASILFATVLVKSDILIKVLTKSRELEQVGSFVSGIFFTSIFTTVPAIVTLGEIAQAYPVFLTALFGGFGALVGDLIIFHFVRDRLSNDMMELFKQTGSSRRIKGLLRLKYFRWFTFLVGGLIIASPLPDELGVTFLGLSRTNTTLFIIISFAFNFMGIYAIGAVARTI